MLIQEFCRATGLGRDTVRFYVKQGLLTPRVGSSARNRFQVFDAAQIERARLIRAAQSVGFTLKQSAALAAAYEEGERPSEERVGAIRAQLTELDARAKRLRQLRGELAARLRRVGAGGENAPPRLGGAMRRVRAARMGG